MTTLRTLCTAFLALFVLAVFERGTSGKCAVYGAATAGATDAASSWSGNTFVDGTPVPRP